MQDVQKAAVPAPQELVSWLRLLALPLWARIAISILVLSVIAGGLALLAHGAWTQEAEEVSSAIALLTVSLPVLMVVIALVFGQNSDRKLTELTRMVLEHDIPRAIRGNFGDAPASALELTTRLRGCCADYCLGLTPPRSDKPFKLRFSVELNVYKVNVCFWLDDISLPSPLTLESPQIAAFRHVILGAVAEGYRFNEMPAYSGDEQHGHGLVFPRHLDAEFLLRPGQRLYFVQDLSFFVRGVLEAALAGARPAKVDA